MFQLWFELSFVQLSPSLSYIFAKFSLAARSPPEAEQHYNHCQTICQQLVWKSRIARLGIS